MPFTFSHPAVVLPFRYIGKQYFSMTALMVGSVIPDFEYFIRIENRSHFSHTFPGIFWFDLPLGIAACFIFHGLVKGPLINNSPYPVYTRLVKYLDFDWNSYFKQNWIKVLCSIIIGICTHLIADKLLHKSSNIVSSVPVIMETQELIDTPKSVYRVIQITFSIIGLALCGLTIWQFPAMKKKAVNYSPSGRYWLIMTALFITILAGIIIKIGYEQTDLIVSCMSAFLLALTISSLVPLGEKKSFAHRQVNQPQ